MPIYMKIEGITGSATGKYNGWIKLNSVQLNPSRSSGSGVNREASAPSPSEIVVSKSMDVASSLLLRMSVEGKGKKVVIHFVKDDGKVQVPYMAVELENTLISSYMVSGHGGDLVGRPGELLTLNYTKITYAATPVASATDVKDRALWNLATGGAQSGP